MKWKQQKSECPMVRMFSEYLCVSLAFFFFFFLCLFRAVPGSYESFQAGVQIRATAAGLYHSHSNVGSELLL